MGDVINFLDYKEAKEQGMSVKALLEMRAQIQDSLSQAMLKDIDEDYLLVPIGENDTWPVEYPYVLEEDLDTGYHDDCDHLEWEVVEEGYQATCTECSLNAWSAPW